MADYLKLFFHIAQTKNSFPDFFKNFNLFREKKYFQVYCRFDENNFLFDDQSYENFERLLTEDPISLDQLKDFLIYYLNIDNVSTMIRSYVDSTRDSFQITLSDYDFKYTFNGI